MSLEQQPADEVVKPATSAENDAPVENQTLDAVEEPQEDRAVGENDASVAEEESIDPSGFDASHSKAAAETPYYTPKEQLPTTSRKVRCYLVSFDVHHWFLYIFFDIFLHTLLVLVFRVEYYSLSTSLALLLRPPRVVCLHVLSLKEEKGERTYHCDPL